MARLATISNQFNVTTERVRLEALVENDLKFFFVKPQQNNKGDHFLWKITSIQCSLQFPYNEQWFSLHFNYLKLSDL